MTAYAYTNIYIYIYIHNHKYYIQETWESSTRNTTTTSGSENAHLFQFYAFSSQGWKFIVPSTKVCLIVTFCDHHLFDHSDYTRHISWSAFSPPPQVTQSGVKFGFWVGGTNFSEDKMGFPPTTPLNHKYGKKHSGDEPSYASASH